jgi:hypothetical protein
VKFTGYRGGVWVKWDADKSRDPPGRGVAPRDVAAGGARIGHGAQALMVGPR